MLLLCAVLCVFTAYIEQTNSKISLPNEDSLLFWRRSNVAKCKPFTAFKIACNQCVCAADGVSSCTRMDCSHLEPAANRKQAKYSFLKRKYDFVPVTMDTDRPKHAKAFNLFKELRERGTDARKGSLVPMTIDRPKHAKVFNLFKELWERGNDLKSGVLETAAIHEQYKHAKYSTLKPKYDIIPVPMKTFNLFKALRDRLKQRRNDPRSAGLEPVVTHKQYEHDKYSTLKPKYDYVPVSMETARPGADEAHKFSKEVTNRLMARATASRSETAAKQQHNHDKYSTLKPENDYVPSPMETVRPVDVFSLYMALGNDLTEEGNDLHSKGLGAVKSKKKAFKMQSEYYSDESDKSA